MLTLLGNTGANPVPKAPQPLHDLPFRPSREGQTAGAGTGAVIADRKAVMVNSILAFMMLVIVLVVVLRYVK
jgi:hypothetical protein